MSDRVAVTGATGFIGRRVVAELREAGHEVIAIGRRSAPGVDVLADGRDPRAMGEALRGATAVIDAAGVVPGGNGDPADNPLMAKALRAAAEHNAVARIVHLGSSAVWGAAAHIDPATPAAPLSDYARSKLAAEDVLRGVPGTAVTTLRLATVYGPGMAGWLGRLLRWAHHGVPLPFAGVNAPRPYLALANVCVWVRWCLERTESGDCYACADVHLGLADLLCALAPGARLFSLPGPILELCALIAGRRDDWRRIAASQRITWPDPIDAPQLRSAREELDALGRAQSTLP